MQLSKQILPAISSTVEKPNTETFDLPERVLQFGTGVLLRALPDYFIHKANQKKIFNGRIVAVKTTPAGSAADFTDQDSLYTLCIRGIEDGQTIEENMICSSISRVLSANEEWDKVLACAKNADLKIIISNTTEVGIQLVAESVFQQPPSSFPAKLLAFLHKRFKCFGDNDQSELIVLPTELLTDNAKKLQSIITELADHNKLDASFLCWLNKRVFFCNTLVDCIVPGKPNRELLQDLQTEFGYSDDLLIISEVYRLWAIEGDEKIKSILSFANADERVIIAPDITKYKELKLRLLNATHTMSCGLAFLSGLQTVKQAMEDQHFNAYINGLMFKDIAPAILYEPALKDATVFGRQVLDRFKNPFLEHQWLSISMQYTSKIAMRAVPLVLQYFKLYNKAPEHFATGFAAYILFMKAIKKEDGKYFGELGGQQYQINDDQADYYFELWQTDGPIQIAEKVLSNEKLWNTDLTKITGLQKLVTEHLQAMIMHGAKSTLDSFV